MRPRGMIDVRCAVCGRTYGFVWVEGAPPKPCTYCGAAPSEQMVADMRHVAEMVALLDKHADGMTPAELTRARVAAGLTLGQAAKILGLTPEQLADVENGDRKLDQRLAVAIDNAYLLAKQPSDPTGQER